jgi:phthalate 3,4-dioxygenase ferredoxin reductase subunit
MLQRLHEDNGVTVRCGIGVTGFTGAERVTGVRLDDGSVLPAAVVVIGIGVVPNTSWLEESALEVADGVLCDETCRAVGTDNVYAVGDVARWFDPRLGATVRVEHWTNATEQAAVVAHNIARPEEPRSHAAVPYFWSDQYGVKLQMAGAVIAGATTTTVTGPPGKTRQAVLWSADSRLVAAFTVDWPKALAVSRQVIAAGGAPEQVQERLAR